MEVRYVPYGLANNFGTHIELNENLKQYPELHDTILEHELSHTQETFTKKDLLLDLESPKFSQIKLIEFMLKHPKSFLQLAPIYRMKGVWYYDINMILIYSFSLLILGVFMGFIFL